MHGEREIEVGKATSSDRGFDRASKSTQAQQSMERRLVVEAYEPADRRRGSELDEQAFDAHDAEAIDDMGVPSVEVRTSEGADPHPAASMCRSDHVDRQRCVLDETPEPRSHPAGHDRAISTRVECRLAACRVRHRSAPHEVDRAMQTQRSGSTDLSARRCSGHAMRFRELDVDDAVTRTCKRPERVIGEGHGTTITGYAVSRVARASCRHCADFRARS